MGELQAIVEFHVELHKFINIDLFQRGFYQLRVAQRIDSKCLHKIEAHCISDPEVAKKTSGSLLTRTKSDLSPQSNQIVLPAGRWNRHTLLSPCFQLLYKNEEVLLNTVFRFKCHLLVQAAECLSAITKSRFLLDIQLCFTNTGSPPTSADDLRIVHTRQVQLHLDLCRGLHYHLPIMFDYFHLSTVTMSVHGSLTTLCLPYLSVQSLSSLPSPSDHHSASGSGSSSSSTCSNGNQTCANKRRPQTAQSKITSGPDEFEANTSVDEHTDQECDKNGPIGSHCPKQTLRPKTALTTAHTPMTTNTTNTTSPPTPLIGYDHLLFGCSFAQLDAQLLDPCQANVLALRERRAQLLHWQLCSILCISLQSVRRKLHEFVKMLPPWQQSKHRKRVFGRLRLKSLSNLAQLCYRSCLENGPKAGNCDLLAVQNAYYAKQVRPGCELRLSNKPEVLECAGNPNVMQPEDYVARVSADLAYLCGCLIVMWQLFVRLVSHNERIAGHLAKVHHLHRCKRFSEAFLVKEKARNQMESMYTSEQSAEITNLADQLRKSKYLHLLPKCAVECVLVDGDHCTLPIIFEERYQPPTDDSISANQPEVPNHAKYDQDHNGVKKQVRRSISDLSSNSSTGSGSTSSSGCVSAGANHRRQLTARIFGKLTKNSTCLPDNWNNEKRKSVQEPLSSSTSISSSLCNSASSSLPTPNQDVSNGSTSTIEEPLLDEHGETTGSASNTENTGNTGNIGSNETNETKERCNNGPEVNDTLLQRLSSYSDCLVSFRHYNNVRGELDEARLLAANGCERSLFHIVETVSLQNMQNGDLPDGWLTNQKMGWHNSVESKGKLNASESLPDLSVGRLQKNIHRLTGKQRTLSRIRLRSVISQPDKRKSKAIGRKWRKSHSGSPAASVNVGLHASKSESSSFWATGKMQCNKLLPVNGDKFVSNFGSKCELYQEKDKENVDATAACCSVLLSADDDSDCDCHLPVFEDTDEEEEQADHQLNLDANVILVRKTGNGRKNKSVLDDEKCTILDMFKLDACLLCGQTTCECSQDFEFTTGLKRLSMITNDLVSFVRAKEEFRQQMQLNNKGWNIYSDFSALASKIPYFQIEPEVRALTNEGVHLVVCVHGLDGNCADLRLVKTYLELGLPTTNFDFLMSESNQGETFDRFEMMTDRLIAELMDHIQNKLVLPAKISFIGHSLGTIIIRAALAKPEMEPYLNRLHCFLSLSGPHLGTAYNNNGLVNMGLWFMQKWKRSSSLQQLCMKDHSDPQQTFLFKLSQNSLLQHFRFVLLCGSSQDHYVPRHSAHIQLCEQAASDRSRFSVLYRQMQRNIIEPIQQSDHCQLIRFDVWHATSGPASTLIGRAAHIAVLDSELFIEKFMAVTALKYFS